MSLVFGYPDDEPPVEGDLVARFYDLLAQMRGRRREAFWVEGEDDAIELWVLADGSEYLVNYDKFSVTRPNGGVLLSG